MILKENIFFRKMFIVTDLVSLSDFMTMRNYEDQLQNRSVHSVNWTNEPRYVISNNVVFWQV